MSMLTSGNSGQRVESSGEVDNKYFAADKSENAVSYLIRKSQSWFETINHNRYIDKVKRSWQCYHGVYYEDGHEIVFGGETGELANLPINHFRNIAEHMVTMITATRPSFQAKTVNTDYKSQTQTLLANGLLEYYLREKRLEKYLKTSVQYAVVMGSGYVKMEWNATSGDIYDYIEPEFELDEFGEPKVDPETGEKLYKLDKESGRRMRPFPIYQGDVEFKNLSPFDVVFDTSKESPEDHQWVLCRSFKNKYDLATKYPEFKEKIEGLRTKTELQQYRLTLSPIDETTDIPVYEFYHLPTESLPKGRYILYLDEEIVLMDTPMPYRKLPVYSMRPSHILGTPYGYTQMFDLIPLQDAVNSLYSTILTNQNAFGVQNILNPRGNDIRVSDIAGGLNFIDYNPVVAGGQSGKPEALNLTNTPPEIFKFIEMLVRDMETISGINSVVRGNPEASLRSANSIAMVQGQALQFINGLQQSYIMLLEDIGTGLVQLLQDFAKVPRIAEISGISNKSKIQEFVGEDLDSINRVIVDVGNSLAQTSAGRVQMADNLIQMGIVKDVNQYFSVISSGKLDVMTEGEVNHNLLIKAENERLIEGNKEVRASAMDKHTRHINQHMDVLADPDLRLDNELVQRVQSHIMEHIELLRTTDPAILALIGEQPLGPAGGSPPNPENVEGMPEQPPQGAMGEIPPVMENEQAQSTAPVPPVQSMPKMQQ